MVIETPHVSPYLPNISTYLPHISPISPQADEMVIETSGGYMRSDSADGLSPLGATGDAAPEQVRVRARARWPVSL